MVSTIFLTVVLALIIGAIVINLSFSKRKKSAYQAKTPAMKVVSSLKARINKSLEDLANNIRTPEVIEEEINLALDEFYTEKSLEAKSVLKTYRNAIDTCNKLQNLLKNNKSQMNSRLNDLKKRYSETEDENKKNQIISISESAMASMKNIDKAIEENNLRLNEIKETKNHIEDQIDLFVTSFNIKKVEILNQVAILKTSSITNPNFNTTTNIDYLIDDLEMSINERLDNNKVDIIFNGASNNDPTLLTNIEIDESIKNETMDFLTK